MREESLLVACYGEMIYQLLSKQTTSLVIKQLERPVHDDS